MEIRTLSLERFNDAALSERDLLARLAWLRDVIGPRLDRYMGYYRNPTTELAATLPCGPGASFSVRPFRQYQELGLPARLTGFRRAADGSSSVTGAIDIQRKEVVIENDIAWRINTLVDFAASRLPGITSTARDAGQRRRLTAVIGAILETPGAAAGAGGVGGAVGLMQELVLQGAICGSAWVHLRPTAELLARLAARAGGEMNNDISQAVENGIAGKRQGAPGEEMAGKLRGEARQGGGTGEATPDPDNASVAAGATDEGGETLPEVARWLRIEVVEAARLCPLPAGAAVDRDGQAIGYAAVLREGAAGGGNFKSQISDFRFEISDLRTRNLGFQNDGWLGRVRSWFVRPGAAGGAGAAEAGEFSFDLFGPGHWQRYERGMLAEEGENVLGFVPFVRYENAADPAAGTRVGPAGSAAVDVGLGDVEPLIGLQDELNTRLSDRAYRVTMTSFRMYLGRGIEDFIKRPIGPGQMWGTDNPEASIEAFGGDQQTPSEDSHINEVREALDKISGVSPVAAGLIRGKLGNLTSAIALRLTLIALLARTERKRAALVQTLAAVVRMALEVLDRAGVVKSAAEDRGIDVNWPTAMPESDMDRLTEAQAKLALGVPRDLVLTELGYGELAT